MKQSFKVLALALVFTASAAFASRVFSGSEAVAKIQASISGTNLTQMGINTTSAKWATLTNGVEYSFMQFTDLYERHGRFSRLRLERVFIPLLCCGRVVVFRFLGPEDIIRPGCR